MILDGPRVRVISAIMDVQTSTTLGIFAKSIKVQSTVREFLSEVTRNRESQDRWYIRLQECIVNDVLNKTYILLVLSRCKCIDCRLPLLFVYHKCTFKMWYFYLTRSVYIIHPFFSLSDHLPLVLHTCRNFVTIDDPFKRFSSGTQFVLPIKSPRTGSPKHASSTPLH